jgi:hypothetical protein
MRSTSASAKHRDARAVARSAVRRKRTRKPTVQGTPPSHIFHCLAEIGPLVVAAIPGQARPPQ